jgi:hypothetical protein
VDVFKTGSQVEGVMSVSDLQQADGSTSTEQLTCIDEEFNISQYSEETLNSILFIEAITLDLHPDYRHPCLKQEPRGEFQIFLFLMRNVVCELRLIDTDAEISRSNPREGEPMYLLLARDKGRGVVGQAMFYYILLVYVKDGLAVRGTVMMLVIPEEHLELLQDLKPRKRRVVLT